MLGVGPCGARSPYFSLRLLRAAWQMLGWVEAAACRRFSQSAGEAAGVAVQPDAARRAPAPTRDGALGAQCARALKVAAQYSRCGDAHLVRPHARARARPRLRRRGASVVRAPLPPPGDRTGGRTAGWAAAAVRVAHALEFLGRGRACMLRRGRAAPNVSPRSCQSRDLEG